MVALPMAWFGVEVTVMDAFRTPPEKSTQDLTRAFLYYMGQPALFEQYDVDRFWAICEELSKRQFDFTQWEAL